VDAVFVIAAIEEVCLVLCMRKRRALVGVGLFEGFKIYKY